jgi:hypothetical protein
VIDWVGPLIGTVVIALAGWLIRQTAHQNDKLNRITRYLFTPPNTIDGIPGAPGKLDALDAQIDLLRKGQLEILKRLEMSNGSTIAQAVEAMTTHDPDNEPSTPPIDVSGSDH